MTKEECELNKLRLKALSDSLWPKAYELFARYNRAKLLANMVAHSNHIVEVTEDGVVFDCGFWVASFDGKLHDSGMWKLFADPTMGDKYTSENIVRAEWKAKQLNA